MSDTLCSSDVAFTPAVKAVQTLKGSRDAYARVEQNGGWRTEIEENLAGVLARTNSMDFATPPPDGRPRNAQPCGPNGSTQSLEKKTPASIAFRRTRR